jgi:hypothetical protein
MDSKPHGATAGEALSHVKNTLHYSALSPDGAGNFILKDMTLKGDDYTRLYNVYLNQAERAGKTQGEIDRWYWQH